MAKFRKRPNVNVPQRSVSNFIQLAASRNGEVSKEATLECNETRCFQPPIS
jgi:hypothetical protein